MSADWGIAWDPSDVDLFGDLNRVINLNAEVANGAFDLRMA
jgi:hypothetical protein